MMEDEQELRIAIQSVRAALDIIRMLQEVYGLSDDAPVRILKKMLMDMYRKMTDDV